MAIRKIDDITDLLEKHELETDWQPLNLSVKSDSVVIDQIVRTIIRGMELKKPKCFYHIIKVIALNAAMYDLVPYLGVHLSQKHYFMNPVTGVNSSLMSKAISHLNEHGYIDIVEGSFKSGKITRIKIKSRFKILLKSVKLQDISLGLPSVVVKNKGKSIEQRNPKSHKAEIEQVKRINEFAKKFYYTQSGVEFIAWDYRRIYSWSDYGINLGGRLYASYQNIPKDQRAEFRINGEELCSFDFSAQHLNLLYVETTKQAYQGEFPYIINGYDRSEIKIAVNVVLNNPTEKRAIMSIANHKANELYDKDFKELSLKVRTEIKSQSQSLMKAILMKHPVLEAHLKKKIESQ